MNVFQPLISDLREKRLWPVVVVLVAGLVAVPVLLAKPAPKPQPAIASIGGATTTSPIDGLPVVALSTTPQFSHLPGHGRDPFTQQMTSTTTTATGTASTTSSASSSSGVTTGSHGSSSSNGSDAGGGGTSTTGSSTTTTQTPTSTSTSTSTSRTSVTPPGLTSTKSYDVALAITGPHGGLNTIDPLVRLSPLPSAKQPLLLELGVIKGGSEVLFVVLPGTILRGPAKCLPGRVDCQIISLAPNQIESLYVKGTTGPSHVSDFAVTAIKTVSHKTAADAGRARRQVSKAGQKLLKKLHDDALTLFPYEPSVGAVVDQRDLTAGGS